MYPALLLDLFHGRHVDLPLQEKNKFSKTRAQFHQVKSAMTVCQHAQHQDLGTSSLKCSYFKLHLCFSCCDKPKQFCEKYLNVRGDGDAPRVSIDLKLLILQTISVSNKEATRAHQFKTYFDLKTQSQTMGTRCNTNLCNVSALMHFARYIGLS